jgi:hypothetical protein
MDEILPIGDSNIGSQKRKSPDLANGEVTRGSWTIDPRDSSDPYKSLI